MRSIDHYLIDLEKLAALGDDVQILSSRCFLKHGTCNSFSLDNSPYASRGQFMELLIIALLRLVFLLIEDIPYSFVHIISPKSDAFTAK
jgi:hypothetical protein